MKQAKKKRQYKRITPVEIARFKAAEAIYGNGSAAVRELTPTIKNVGDRAYTIRKKTEAETASVYVTEALEQIAVAAIGRLGELVESADEQVATRNVHYALDQFKGKAVSRNINLNGKLNIQSVLD